MNRKLVKPLDFRYGYGMYRKMKGTAMTDIVERLRQPLGREETLLQWDHWRRLMEQTCSSLSRDAFEAWCDLQDEEERIPAATLIEQLRADNARLREAATALRDDMLMRAEMNKHLNDGELVVEAGIGVWARFNAALQETIHDR